MAYDIIGDIHGQADRLLALLQRLGYRQRAGAWRHPQRQVIFVGDYIDRGPAQLRTLDLVRRMTEAGSALAILGNHELNAIAWHTPDPRAPGEYLRPHFRPGRGEKNRRQHAAFLAEVEHRPALHAELIDWFLSLPLWLELPGLRVVHACWHAPFLEWLRPQLRDGRYLSRERMPSVTDEPAEEAEKDNACPSLFKAVEVLTKGIEVALPAGHHFHDKDGTRRERVRVRWWDADAVSYRRAAILPDAARELLPDTPIPAHARIGASDTPVFFGHYWLSGTPRIQSARAACVDYSAGKGGALVAYRFDGEETLSSERFVAVD